MTGDKKNLSSPVTRHLSPVTAFMQIVLIASEQTAQAALLDVLRAAGMRALVASGTHTAGVEVCATQVHDSVDAAAPLFVLVGIGWGAFYAQWVEPRVHLPDWLSGLCFALLPLSVAVVVVLPVLDGAES